MITFSLWYFLRHTDSVLSAVAYRPISSLISFSFLSSSLFWVTESSLNSFASSSVSASEFFTYICLLNSDTISSLSCNAASLKFGCFADLSESLITGYFPIMERILSDAPIIFFPSKYLFLSITLPL